MCSNGILQGRKSKRREGSNGTGAAVGDISTGRNEQRRQGGFSQLVKFSRAPATVSGRRAAVALFMASGIRVNTKVDVRPALTAFAVVYRLPRTREIGKSPSNLRSLSREILET